MGYYINPVNETKEAFCARQIPVSREAFLNFNWEDQSSFPICWMHNGAFTALGIAFSQREAEVFANMDGRPKKFYLAQTTELLKPETNADAGFMKVRENG